MIVMANPSLGKEEEKAVCDVLASGMIACGDKVTEFEKAFAGYIGVSHGIATTSGTTALEVALRAIGIQQGDRVLTTAFSFIASTNAIIYVGGEPVFVDIDARTFNLDIDEMERILQRDKSVKAILAVHLFGRPCAMDRIVNLAQKYHVKLVEDCAQAHGAEYNGKKVGSFGDAAAFSFYPTKNMTTGEGGIVLTNDEAVSRRARMYINHGMETRYYHDIIGYNYRMTNIAAAIGLCQLEKLDFFNQKRREHATLYESGLKNPLVRTPKLSAGHVYHQYTVMVLDGMRQKLADYLKEHEIGYGIFYPLSIPEQKCYANFNFIKKYPVIDQVKEAVLSLPVHPFLTEEEQNYIIEKINSFRS